VLFSGESFGDKIGSDSDATQNVLICPILLQIMQGPVKCSDGKTYERAEIERWFQEKGTSPLTTALLQCEDGDARKLKCTSDIQLQEKMQEFKHKKKHEEDQRKKDAEGEEEKNILRQRFGIRSGEVDLGHEGEGQRNDSAGKLLDRMMTQDSGVHQACLIGPPASGKTVTMLRIVYAAVMK